MLLFLWYYRVMNGTFSFQNRVFVSFLIQVGRLLYMSALSWLFHFAKFNIVVYKRRLAWGSFLKLIDAIRCWCSFYPWIFFFLLSIYRYFICLVLTLIRLQRQIRIVLWSFWSLSLLEILGFDLGLIKDAVLSNRYSVRSGFNLIEPFDRLGFRVFFDIVNIRLKLKPDLVRVLPALI